jgi:hypothetical protein
MISESSKLSSQSNPMSLIKTLLKQREASIQSLPEHPKHKESPSKILYNLKSFIAKITFRLFTQMTNKIKP